MKETTVYTLLVHRQINNHSFYILIIIFHALTLVLYMSRVVLDFIMFVVQDK